MKKQVSENAVFQRLKRHLEKSEGVLLRKGRDNNQARLDVGRYYTQDINNNSIVHTHINLELYAKDESVMLANEVMVEA